jgi:4-amino-4-deoxy-L-arabinose transferase-like glycosyltransferase
LKFSPFELAFLIATGLLTILNLLAMNDATSIMDGAEAANVYTAQQHAEGVVSGIFETGGLAGWLAAKNYGQVGFDLFLLRLPNVLLLILTLLIFYGLAEQLFGKQTVMLTILVVCSSFLVIPATKFMVNEIWLLAFQLPGLLSLVFLLIQPSWTWRLVFWLCTAGAVLIQPMAGLVSAFSAWLLLALIHPEGRSLFRIFDIGMWLAIIVATYISGQLSLDYSGFLFYFGSKGIGLYLLANLLGILPWLAFLPAAFVDLFKKLKKREEMAIILSVFMVFGILSFGLVLQVALALLVAKQVENYFKPNYPFASWVKSAAVLGLNFTFILVAVLLLTGYDALPAIGFRSRMGMGGVFWAFSFLAVVGIFMKNKNMIVACMSLSGILAMLLFFTQISPRLEFYRDLPQKMADAIVAASPDQKPAVYIFGDLLENGSLPQGNEIYLKAKKIDYTILTRLEDLNTKSGIFVLDELAYDQLDPELKDSIEKVNITGRDQLLGEERSLWVLKK